ncbi:MAG: hypothetical protein ACI38A_07155, partial [Candidatus Ornithomonoglobus sp.]
GTAAYTFKAKVPNGNYNVTVNTTAASMTSEVVESVSATTGISKSGSTFNVAVCDGVLDLTFPAASTVTTLAISQAAAKSPLTKPKVYVIGDSTTNNTANGACSWGNCVSNGYVAIPDCFSGFSNNGMAGRDSVSFYNEGRVETVLLNVCPGDYVTVNMGINSKETGEAAAYYTLMKYYYVEGIIQRGGIPVIVTATPIGFSDKSYPYDAENGFTTSRGDGARNDVLRQIASEENLDCIELGQRGEDWMNTLTPNDVNAYNAEHGTSFTTVLEMVQSWYLDHNHYTAYLGTKIGEYLLGELEKIYNDDISERVIWDISPSDIYVPETTGSVGWLVTITNKSSVTQDASTIRGEVTSNSVTKSFTFNLLENGQFGSNASAVFGIIIQGLSDANAKIGNITIE